MSPCPRGHCAPVGKRDNKQINVYDTKKVMQERPLGVMFQQRLECNEGAATGVPGQRGS